MKMNLRKLLWLVPIFLLVPTKTLANDLTARLQKQAVSIVTMQGTGTGSIIKGINGNGKVKTYILTVSHIVEHLDAADFNIRIYQDINHAGKFHHRNECLARVYKKSHWGLGKDLALLELNVEDFGEQSISLYRGVVLHDVGDEIWHIGNYKGWMYQSISHGHISFIDRVVTTTMPKNVDKYKIKLDQIQCEFWPGSSGGPIYNGRGQLIGILSDGYDKSTAGMVPVRTILNWLKEIKFEVQQ